MAWLVQPREIKGVDGGHSGIWHLTASSDEGGGFHAGCEHEHKSAEEAQNCQEAKVYLGSITGFPVYEDEAPTDDPYDRGRRDVLNALLQLNPEAARKLHDLTEDGEEFTNVAGQLPFDVVFWVTEVAEQLGIQPKE